MLYSKTQFEFGLTDQGRITSGDSPIEALLTVEAILSVLMRSSGDTQKNVV